MTPEPMLQVCAGLWAAGELDSGIEPKLFDALLVADNSNSVAVFDVCKDYRRVVTEGYRLDPWAYGTGANERVVHLTRTLFALGYPAAQAIAEHVGWTPGTPTALRLLEVGCGSAVYGVVALTRLPAARLTAQDRSVAKKAPFQPL